MVSKEIEDYIAENLPICSNKIELSYAIYILLGQILYYNPFYANTKDKNLIIQPESVTLKNPYVICYTWSEIYNTLLNKYGINSKINNKNKEHSYVEIEEDNMKITADATKSSLCSVYDISNDLASIKFGLDINFFNLCLGQTNYQDKRLRLLEIKNIINKKLGIETGLDKEIDQYVKMLDESDISLEERILLLINLLNNLYRKCDGEVERKQLFDRYYKIFFKDEDLNNKQISITYDECIMSKKLIIVPEQDIYVLEDKDGLRILQQEEIDRLIITNKIKFKYQQGITTYHNLIGKNISLVKTML